MNLKLVPLTRPYLDLIHRWRNRDRTCFVDSQYVSKTKQLAWFKRYQTDPAQKMYLILTGQKPIGFIGLKLNPPENPDFGPYLLGEKSYARQGIMIWALREIMKLHPAPKYHGLVKKTNPAALALDQKVGFQIIKETSRHWHVELLSPPRRTSHVAPRTSFIPLLQPSYSPAESRAVKKVLQSGWWGLGPVTKQLETEFAQYAGTRYAVAVNSATSALHLAVHILKGTKTQGNIITTPLTFVSTAAVGLYENLEVRFADIDEKTLCLDPQSVTALVDQDTITVIPVHYAGYRSPMPYALSPTPIVEDCAHAVATTPPPQTGILACWSFHPVKNIATGDGGMLTTNDADIYKALIQLRWLGIDLDTWARETKGYNWEYHIPSLGFKYHANDIMSSIALAQLRRLPELNAKRAHLAERYLTKLKSLPFTLPPESSSWHLFVLRLNDPNLRPQFIDYLRQHHISVGVHYKPLHHYPIFKWAKPLPVTDKVYPRLVDIPLFPDLSIPNQDYIIHTIKEFFRNLKS